MKVIVEILGEDEIQNYIDNDNIDGAIDELCQNLSEKEANELISSIEKIAAKDWYKSSDRVEDDRIEELLDCAKRPRISTILNDYMTKKNQFSNLYEENVQEYFTVLEVALGKDVLQECFNEKSTDRLMEELHSYLSKEDVEDLVRAIEKSANNEEEPHVARWKLSKLFENVRKENNGNISLAEVISDYVVLNMYSDGDVLGYTEKDYVYNTYGRNAYEYIGEIAVVIGREKILDYYNNDNIEGLTEELHKYLSNEKFNELEGFIQEQIQGKYSYENEQKNNEIIEELCYNMNQENLTEIMYNVHQIYDLSISYLGSDISVFYYSNSTGVRYNIDREELLKMDIDSLMNILNDKIKEKISEKQTEEPIETTATSEKKIKSEDIMLATEDLLIKGSGNSQIVNDVKQEIVSLTKEREGGEKQNDGR